MEAHVRNQESHVASSPATAATAKAESKDDPPTAEYDSHKHDHAQASEDHVMSQRDRDAHASGDHVMSHRDRDVGMPTQSDDTADGRTDLKKPEGGDTRENSGGKANENSASGTTTDARNEGIKTSVKQQSSTEVAEEIDSEASSKGKPSSTDSEDLTRKTTEQVKDDLSPTGKRSSAGDCDGLDRKMKQATLQQMWSNSRSSSGNNPSGSPSSKDSGSGSELDPDNVRD